MTIPHLEFITRPETRTCQLKKEGAVNDRTFHYPVDYERPTSGPKFCPEPRIIHFLSFYLMEECWEEPSDKHTYFSQNPCLPDTSWLEGMTWINTCGWVTVAEKPGGNLWGSPTGTMRHLTVPHYFRERIRKVKTQFLIITYTLKIETCFILFCRST